MESEAAEASPDLSQHGFKGILSKARNKSKANDSKVSINGTDNSSDSHGIRSSIDSARDKLRASRTSSLDDGLPANNSSMSKLIPKRIQKKRKERKEAKQAAKQEETQEDDGRGRSISEQAATSAAPQQRSRSTLGESLITNDSDVES